MSDKLTKLEIRENQLQARIQSAKARESIAHRKKDTRKKILIGAFFMSQYEKNGEMNALIKKMDAYLIRDNERALFDLPPLQKTSPNK